MSGGGKKTEGNNNRSPPRPWAGSKRTGRERYGWHELLKYKVYIICHGGVLADSEPMRTLKTLMAKGSEFYGSAAVGGGGLWESFRNDEITCN